MLCDGADPQTLQFQGSHFDFAFYSKSEGRKCGGVNMFTVLINSKHRRVSPAAETLRERLSEGSAKAWLSYCANWEIGKSASIFALMKSMTSSPWKWHIYHPGDLCTPRLQGSSSIWRGQIWLQIYPCNLSTALNLLTVFSIKVDAVLLNMWWHRNVRQGRRAARNIQTVQRSQAGVGDNSHEIIWIALFLLWFPRMKEKVAYLYEI